MTCRPRVCWCWLSTTGPTARRARCANVMHLSCPCRSASSRSPSPGISFARNRAVAAACAWGADLVAFLDDDDIPRQTGCGSSLQCQRETEADLVFGFCRLPSGPAASRLVAQQPLLPATRSRRPNRYGLPGWAGTYNVLISRRVLEELSDRRGTVPGRVRQQRRRGHGPVHPREGCGLHLRRGDRIDRGAAPGSPHRMTIGGIVRRGFLRATSRVMLARAHLPREQVRRLAWNSWGKLGKALLLLPLVWNRSRPRPQPARASRGRWARSMPGAACATTTTCGGADERTGPRDPQEGRTARPRPLPLRWLQATAQMGQGHPRDPAAGAAPAPGAGRDRLLHLQRARSDRPDHDGAADHRRDQCPGIHQGHRGGARQGAGRGGHSVLAAANPGDHHRRLGPQGASSACSSPATSPRW